MGMEMTSPLKAHSETMPINMGFSPRQSTHRNSLGKAARVRRLRMEAPVWHAMCDRVRFGLPCSCFGDTLVKRLLASG